MRCECDVAVGVMRQQRRGFCPLIHRNNAIAICAPHGTIALQRAAVTRSTSTGTKTKAYAGNGVYEALSLAIVADLATESVDGDADDIACRRIVEAPDMLRDRRCRHDGTAVAHEVLQQTEFCPREARRHTVEIEGALRGIETERADL